MQWSQNHPGEDLALEFVISNSSHRNFVVPCYTSSLYILTNVYVEHPTIRHQHLAGKIEISLHLAFVFLFFLVKATRRVPKLSVVLDFLGA